MLDAKANVVILTMAWHTHEDTSLYSRRPQEPDLETLVYWVQRLEPLIAANKEEEVIVIFCNRTGSEDDVMYTGTSAVLGIRRGEVYVYGLLGRGVKELLVVDTSKPPISKLSDAEALKADETELQEPACSTENDMAEVAYEDASVEDQPPQPAPLSDNDPDLLSPISPIGPFSPTLSMAAFSPTSPTEPFSPMSPIAPFSPVGPTPLELRWAPTPHGMEAVLEEPGSPVRLHIPARPFPGEPTASIDNTIMGSKLLPPKEPPLATSPPQLLEPKHRGLPRLVIPATPWRFNRKSSPFPWHVPGGSQAQILTGKVAMTPITAFDIDSAWDSASVSARPQSQSLLNDRAWRGAQTARSTIGHFPVQRKEPVRSESTTSRSMERKYRRAKVYSPESPKALVYKKEEQMLVDQAKSKPVLRVNTTTEETERPTLEGVWKREELEERWRGSGSQVKESSNDHRNDELSELAITLSGLGIVDTRPNSTFTLPIGFELERCESPCPDRPFSPKSRNVSRNGSRANMRGVDPVLGERASSLSRGSIPISVSPSIFDTQEAWRPPSVPPSAPSGIVSGSDLSSSISIGIVRPVSRLGQRLGSVPRGPRRRSLDGKPNNLRSRSLPGVGHEEPVKPRLRSASIVRPQAEGVRRPRSLLRFSISTSSPLKEAPEQSFRRPRSGQERMASSGPIRPRNVSRGRQPGARGTSVERSDSVGEKRSEASRRRSVQKGRASSVVGHYNRDETEVTLGDGSVVSIDHGYVPGENDIIRTVSVVNGVAADNSNSPQRSMSLTRSSASVPPPILLPPQQKKPAREASTPGWKNPYDISLQPFATPPLARALAAGDLVPASSNPVSPFGDSPGPLTPKYLMTTPEPMILIPSSATMPQAGTGMENYGLKLQDELPDGVKAATGLSKGDNMNQGLSKDGMPEDITRSRVSSW